MAYTPKGFQRNKLGKGFPDHQYTHQDPSSIRRNPLRPVDKDGFPINPNIQGPKKEKREPILHPDPPAPAGPRPLRPPKPPKAPAPRNRSRTRRIPAKPKPAPGKGKGK